MGSSLILAPYKGYSVVEHSHFHSFNNSHQRWLHISCVLDERGLQGGLFAKCSLPRGCSLHRWGGYMRDRQDITQYSIRSESICIPGITGRFCWYRNFMFFAIRYTKVSAITRSGIARSDCICI